MRVLTALTAMSAPAGWYPDPQTPVPGAPPQQRYWDGQAWTEHVAPVNPAYEHPAAGQASYGAQQPYAQGYAGLATTPDGAPLAGWWHRVGAYLIDFVVLGLVITALAFPFIRDVLTAFREYLDVAMTAAQNGQPAPSTAALTEKIAGSTLVIGVIGLAVNLVYTVCFLLWKQATPGKLAVGLRVRLRERPDLPLTSICLRWLVQTFLPGALGQIPLVGALFSLFGLLDDLWPLWDSKKQALHDKAAKTNVVRVR